MKKTTIAILVALALAASLLLAQGMPKSFDPAAHVQRHVKYLTTVLSLNAAQQQQATTIFTNAANAGSNLHPQMAEAHKNLSTAVKSNDAATIDQAAASIGNMTAQMISTHAKAQAAFYQILTPDQQNKLNQLQDEGPGPGHHVFFFGEGPGPLPPGPPQ